MTNKVKGCKEEFLFKYNLGNRLKSKEIKFYKFKRLSLSFKICLTF